MKRFGLFALAMSFITLVAYGATTQTTNYQLNKPGDGDKNYGELLRDNFDTIDEQLNINETGLNGHLADTADAHDASAISTTVGLFSCTGSTTVQAYLDCLDGTLDPGVSGIVLIAGAQTITGVKTFSLAPVFSSITSSVLTTDSGGVVTGSTFAALSPLTTKGDLLSYSTTEARQAVGTDGQVLESDSTATNGIAWKNKNPRWRKLTYAYTDFSTAATTFAVTAFSLAAGEGIDGVVIKNNTAFTGGSISAYTVKVGQSGDDDEYAPAFDIFHATAATYSQANTTMDVPNFTTTTDVIITATSTGANLSAATAGSVDIYIRTFLLP